MIDHLVNVPENIIITRGFAAGDLIIFTIANEPIDMQPVGSDGPVSQLLGPEILLELIEIPHFSPPYGLVVHVIVFGALKTPLLFILRVQVFRGG